MSKNQQIYGENRLYCDFGTKRYESRCHHIEFGQIGETAKKLSEDAKRQFSDIDWQKIIGLRNMISHEYEGINIAIIYSIATIHVPQLLDALVNN